jgi:hypothetical protein
LEIRRVVKITPRKAPCLRSASSEYSEQEG